MINIYLNKLLKPIIEDAVINASIIKLNNHNPDRFRDQAVAEGLRHLFDKKWFDICQMDAIIVAARIVPNGETMVLLRPLHCREWADMQVEFRNEVYTRILGMFH